MDKKDLLKILLAISLLLLAACSEINYCLQCAVGHLDVRSSTRPIVDVIQDPLVPEAERQKLSRVLAVRTFAVEELELPDNDSYRSYADIGRPYVVWNVVATPEFSLAPKQWCYPVVGCLAYRGYFEAENAETMAEELRAQGYDVDVYGVKAYSTLKWFDDPVLNTFLDGADSHLASLIFHELSHQVVYAADDCSFNEAFAKTVEMEGLRRWLKGNATGNEWQSYLDKERRGEEFLAILGQTRGQLTRLYSQPLPDDQKRLAKQALLAELETGLRRWSEAWPNPAPVNDWLARGLNNARLATIATYRELVPAFQGLLAAKDGDLKAFYVEAGRLAELPATERTAQLRQYGKFETETACVEAAPVGGR